MSLLFPHFIFVIFQFLIKVPWRQVTQATNNLPGRDLLQLHPGDGGQQRGADRPGPQLPPPQP